MADLREPSDEERKVWFDWVAERPEVVRKAAENIRPWKLYRIRGDSHRVVLYAFDELTDGRVHVKVDVLRVYNPEGLAFERRVFGVEPESLVECDLPTVYN